MTVRTEARINFLTGILTGAIENGGHGWFTVLEYRWIDKGADAYALVKGDDEQYRITLDLIARGLGVIKNAYMAVPAGQDPKEGRVLHNTKTSERLYLAPDRRREIMLADRTNGDEGDLDVVDYLAIVECGVFGCVVYA